CPEAGKCAKVKPCSPPGLSCDPRNSESWLPSAEPQWRSFPGHGWRFFAPETKSSMLHKSRNPDKFAMATVRCCKLKWPALAAFLNTWGSLATAWKTFEPE